jgi:hypothetical protein
MAKLLKSAGNSRAIVRRSKGTPRAHLFKRLKSLKKGREVQFFSGLP